MRLGKNGGTQSKCVENTTSGSPTAAMTLIRGFTGSEIRLPGSAIAPAAAPVPNNHDREGMPRATRPTSPSLPVDRFDVDQLSRRARRWIYRIHFSSSVRASVLSSRYFTITGVASDRPHSLPAPTVTARAPGTTTAPAGTTSGCPGGRLDDRSVHQVVDRRRSREHGARGDHRALLDHRAFVETGVAADQHVVFDDHRHGAHRLEHAADLRRGADVHARADLRARSDQRVRIHQRSFADVGADVDVHRRHADHAAGRDARRRASPIRPARCGCWTRRRIAARSACPCRRTAGRPTDRRCRRT